MSSPIPLRARNARLAVVLAAMLAAAACATTSALKDARLAEEQQDYDRAVVEYAKALKEKPDDRTRASRSSAAKIRASQDHFQRGRRLAATGKYEEALLELQIAAELNPANGDVDDGAADTRTALRNKIAVAARGQDRAGVADRPRPRSRRRRGSSCPTASTCRDRSCSATPAAATCSPRSPASPTSTSSSTRRSATRRSPIDLRNATFDDALTSVTASTRTFYRVTAPRTVTIVPDTPAKRREYQEEIVRTFYLSNADLKETIDLLRIVVDARRISPITATNAHHHQGHARAHRRRGAA